MKIDDHFSKNISNL